MSLRRRDFLKLAAASAIVPLDLSGLDALYSNIPQEIPLTPLDQFHRQVYQPHAFPVPIPAEQWHLSIRGLTMDAPHTLTWEALQQLPKLDTVRTIACINNPNGSEFISTAAWEGVALHQILAGLPIPPEHRYAKLTSADGYQTGLPLSILLHEDTVLAYRMNNQPLPPEHGYPVRLLVGNVYGQKMPKWITQIEFTSTPFKGFWEAYGWSDEAIVQPHAFFTSPTEGNQLRGGAILQGLAFAGARRIAKVEVSADGGDWQAAHLLQPPAANIWTPWYLRWIAPSTGRYHLEVRATDSDGNTQIQRPDPFFKRPQKNGNALIQGITVEVR